MSIMIMLIMILGNNTNVIMENLQPCRHMISDTKKLIGGGGGGVSIDTKHTPVLKELHWSQMDRRIEYKILLHAYKALNGLTPEYLCNMVESCAPDRLLRSASQNLFAVPRGKHCQYGMRTFAMVVATLWNSLNVRDRGNRIRGSPSLESFNLILRLFFLRSTSTLFLFDLNIWVYLFIACRISVLLSFDFCDCLAMFYLCSIIFKLYRSSALEFIIERYISIVYYYIIFILLYLSV